MLVSYSGQKPRSDNRKGRPNSAPHTSPQNQAPSARPHTTHPPSQQPRKSQNPQHKESRGSEARGPQQDGKDRNQSNRNPRRGDNKDSNQSNRNPRRGNQRQQPRPRDTRPESSNERKETRKEAEHSSQISEETTQLEKEKHSQSGNEGMQSQKSDSTNKEHAQAHQARGQRDHGEDRPQNRSRRRGGRRGAEGGQNERGPSRGVTDKGKNGPLERGPSEKRNLGTEGKEAEGTEVGSDSPAAKNSESSSGVSKLQDFSVVNGKEADTGRTNSSECINGEKAHEGDTSVKEALPQRPDRGSRRRGAQRDRKDGPHPRQTQNKSLNGTKPVENGMDHSSAAENSNIQNGSEEPKESPQNEKLPVAGKETKINGQTLQSDDKDFDKSYVPKVNGYIPVKEVNEVSIDR